MTATRQILRVSVIYLSRGGGFDAALARAIAAGGSVVLSCTELPESDAGFIALIMDAEGNNVGLQVMS